MSKPCPVENIVREALAARRYEYQEPSPDNLDFYVPALGVSIECKQFYSDRIAGQMQRTENVIVIQGMGAARAFAAMLDTGQTKRETIKNCAGIAADWEEKWERDDQPDKAHVAALIFRDIRNSA